MFEESDQLTGDQNRRTGIQRAGRMVLDPLAEVGIGMFVAVVVGGRQLMMHILRDRERRQSKQDNKQRQRYTPAEQRVRMGRTEHHP